MKTKTLIFILFVFIFGCKKKNIENDEIGALNTDTNVTINSIIERGYLESAITSAAIINVSGDILSLIENGKRVKKGDLIVVTDPGELLERIEDLESSKQSQLIAFKKQTDLLEYERFKHHKQVEVDSTSLEIAIQTLSLERSGLSEAEIRLLDIEIAIASNQYIMAADDLLRDEEYYKQQISSLAKLEATVQNARTAKASLEQIILNKKLQLKPIKTERFIELQSEIDRYSNRMSMRIDRWSRTSSSISNQCEIINRTISKIDYQIEELRTQLGQAKLYANVDGIFKINKYRNNRRGGGWALYKQGVRIYKGDVVGYVSSPGRYRITLMINEADMKKIKIGFPVNISVPAFPQKRFQGKVVELGSIGRDRFEIAKEGEERGVTGVTVFNAAVEFDGQGVTFYPGMSAIAEILIQEENK